MSDPLRNAIEHAERELARQTDGPVMLVRAHVEALVGAATIAELAGVRPAMPPTCRAPPCVAPDVCAAFGCDKPKPRMRLRADKWHVFTCNREDGQCSDTMACKAACRCAAAAFPLRD